MRHLSVAIEALLRLIYLSPLTVFAAALPSRATDEVNEVRVDALDCGHVEFMDTG